MVSTNMPRPALLNVLPRVFHPSDDDQPRLLDALLGAMEETFLPIHERLDCLETYLDWASAPHQGEQDFLTWLGTWVGVSLWPEWSEAKKRFVISQAATLYQYRGTAVGIEYLIVLFLGVDVSIREWDWPKGLTIGHESTIGLDGPLINQPNIHRCFVVCWSTDQDALDPNIVRALHRVIQAEKPIHTDYYVQIQTPRTISPQHLKKLIIGESSIIGEFIIEGED